MVPRVPWLGVLTSNAGLSRGAPGVPTVNKLTVTPGEPSKSSCAEDG